MADLYEKHVRGKTAEEILAQGDTVNSNQSPYLQVAAHIRSNQDLIEALKTASNDSTNTARRIVRLTRALVGAAVLQAVATGWSHLAWWFAHGFRFGG